MKQYVLSLLLFVMAFLPLRGQTGHFFPSDRFSSSLIANLCQDKYGSLWIATDYGLNRFDGYQFETFLHSDKDPWSICNNAVVTMLSDRDGRLWVGTNRGLDRYDEAANGFVHYRFDEEIQPRITGLVHLSDGKILVTTAGYGAYTIGSDDKLQPTDDYADEGNNRYYGHIYEDSKRRIWKTGYDNLVVMKQNGKFQHFESRGEPVAILEQAGEVMIVGTRGIRVYRNGRMEDADIDLSVLGGKDVLFSTAAKDADGNIYIGTRGRGIFRVPRGSRRMERYAVDVFGTDLNTAKVWSILSDRNGNLWLGLQLKGLVLVPQRPMQFKNWSFAAQNINLGSSITSVCEGEGGITWCTVQGVGIYGFDNRGHVVAHPAAPDAVEFIFRDHMRRYWVGTDDGLYAYNPATGASTLKVSFDCDKFNDMTSDDTGRIYISTFSRGFCVYDPETGELKNYRNEGDDTVKVGHLCNDWVMCMMPDAEGNIWLGTASGVSCFNPRTGSFHTQGWHQLLNGTMCFSLCAMSNGNIVIGTASGLYLYDRQKRRTERFPASEALNDKSISYVVQSNDGDIWCSTSMGIWQYDVSRHRFVGHVNGNGLSKKEYLYAVGMHTDKDVICFGNNDGLTVFRPSEMGAKVPVSDEVYLTGFMAGSSFVNTRSVLNGVQVTDRAVIDNDHFKLSYLDHTVTLCFSQLNFDNPANVTFEYNVNGGEWISKAEGVNEITLSHLQPGTYKINVRALAAGVYSPEKTITVTIRAPWYRSTLAYILYFMLLLGLLGLMGWLWHRRTHRRLDEEKM